MAFANTTLLKGRKLGLLGPTPLFAKAEPSFTKSETGDKKRVSQPGKVCRRPVEENPRQEDICTIG